MAKILVIGGGVAGLSAGIYAQKRGHQAIVCERHFLAGGNLTGWRRGEYHIYNCIHWLTGTNPNTATYRMWKDLGALGDIDIYQSNSLFTCDCNGKRLSLYRDLDKTEREMLSASPEDAKEIKSFFKAVRAVQAMEGIAGKNHNRRASIVECAASLPILLKYYKLTTGELAKKFKNPLVKRFFTSMLTEHFGSVALIFIIAHYCGDNAGIPAGSSLAMAKRMAAKFKELGGELLLKKEAVKVNCEGDTAKSATFSDGETIEADYVVMAVDPAVAFGKLLDIEMPKALKKHYENKREMRFSSYHCAFACDLPKIPFEGDIIFELSDRHKFRLGSENLIIREYSHEKGFAPEGKNILQTMTFCDERGANRFIELYKNGRELYEKRKKRLAAQINTAIVEKLPELDGHIECIDMWTPATYKRFVDSDIGSYMSFAFSAKVLPIVLGNKIKEIKNVVLATQWLQDPGGLPIAAESGKRAIDTICKMAKKKKAAAY